MQSSIEHRPPSLRSAKSLSSVTSIVTSPLDGGEMTLQDVSTHQRNSNVCATPTPSASRHTSKIFRMLVGEPRSRNAREHKSARDQAKEFKRINATSSATSAELGGRTRPKPSKPLKTLFGAHSISKTSGTSRKSRRPSTNLHSRFGIFSGSGKFIPSIPHAHPASNQLQARPLIQPRIPSVFVPSLPEELWLLIFKYAAYPPFVDLPTPFPKPVSALNPSYNRKYPFPTTYDPYSEAVSFMHHPTAHTHISERLAAYRAQMCAKAALRYVCRAWSVIAHEVLYEFIWVASAKEGRELAGKLCGDVGEIFVGASISVGGKEDTRSEHEDKGSLGRKWNGKQKQQVVPAADAASVVSRKSSSYALAPPSVGRWIKRLHVETRALERCSPHDLLLILQNCPNLEEYSDYKSVRRPMHPLMLSLSDVAPFSVGTGSDDHSALVAARRQHQQALLTPDALLYNLLSRPLRRLTWTNYDYDATDFEAGVRFYEDVVAPRLDAMGRDLEYLELVLSGTATHGMGQRSSNAWGVGGACADRTRGDLFRPGPGQWGTAGMSPTLSKNPARSMYGAANMLTQLEAAYTSTSTTVHLPSLSFDSTPGAEIMPSVDGYTYSLCLPSLRTLKATLDNATFLVLSTWDMPQITHLSIVAADFGYAAPGFRRFFEVHGLKLKQLELGHSSGAIEEAWITEPAAVHDLARRDGHDITLEAWCPALAEFICSADAEWNWQRPDWIAPHVLLPSHAGVQFIGVRDMEKRLMCDLDEALRRRRGDGWRDPGAAIDDFDNIEGWSNWTDADDEADGEHREDDPYFALLQQFGSLLRSEAFPSLLYVRDMSWESDIMRRTCTMRPLPPSATASASPSPPPEPLPLHAARHTPYSTYPSPFMPTQPNQHWWSAAVWAQPAGGGKKPAAKESQAQIAAREAEEALTRAYGRRLNVFWRRVVRMCRRRGVWLEDCFGVNITKANLKQAVSQ